MRNGEEETGTGEEEPGNDLKNYMFTNSSMKLINYPIYGKRISDEQRNALNNGTRQEIQRRTQAEAEGRREQETSMLTVLGNPNLRGEIGSYLGGKKKASKKTLKKKVTKKKTKKTKKIKK